MPSSVAEQGARRHRLSLENVQPSMAKVSLNSLETVDFPREIGRVIQRAISLVGWSNKETAARISRDPAQLARWIAGTERPQFDALWAVEELRQPLVQCFAELAGADVRTEISFQRRTA